MTEKTTLIEFPCDFLIKIIGKNTENFTHDVLTIVRKHCPNTLDEAIQYQKSQQSSYIAISATVYALNQVSLDALYLELTQHPDMKMVL